MTALRTVAAALAAAALPLVALAQLPPPREPPRPEPPGPVPLRTPKPVELPPQELSLTWLGQSAFVLRSPGGAAILIDPIPGTIGYELPAAPIPADAVAMSHEHFDHTNVDLAAGDPRELHALGDAGGSFAGLDTQVKDVHVGSVPAFHDEAKGAKRGKTGLLVFDVAGQRIVHLGDLGQPELTAEQVKALGKVDVLLVPVGGHYTIGPEAAARIVAQVAPRRAVVPMHFETPSLKIEELGPVEPFLARFPADRVRKVGGSTLRIDPGAKAPAKFEVAVLAPQLAAKTK